MCGHKIRRNEQIKVSIFLWQIDNQERTLKWSTYYDLAELLLVEILIFFSDLIFFY